MEDTDQLTLQDILHWIMDHSDDLETMDKINKATFPFTSKYINYMKKQQEEL